MSSRRRHTLRHQASCTRIGQQGHPSRRKRRLRIAVLHPGVPAQELLRGLPGQPQCRLRNHRDRPALRRGRGPRQHLLLPVLRRRKGSQRSLPGPGHVLLLISITSRASMGLRLRRGRTRQYRAVAGQRRRVQILRDSQTSPRYRGWFEGGFQAARGRLGPTWGADDYAKAGPLHMDHARQLHVQISAGHRRSPAPIPDQHRATRIWVDGGNCYYWTSDLLPKYMSFEAAAKALGISRAPATKASQRGELRTSWMGRSRVVSVRSLMQALGIADMIVHPDDVENGAASAGAG
jgi:hypothetical protein